MHSLSRPSVCVAKLRVLDSERVNAVAGGSASPRFFENLHLLGELLPFLGAFHGYLVDGARPVRRDASQQLFPVLDEDGDRGEDVEQPAPVLRVAEHGVSGQGLQAGAQVP